jgi:hypothetical protein
MLVGAGSAWPSGLLVINAKAVNKVRNAPGSNNAACEQFCTPLALASAWMHRLTKDGQFYTDVPVVTGVVSRRKTLQRASHRRCLPGAVVAAAGTVLQ